MTIQLDHELLAFPDFEQKLFDEHKVEEVVKATQAPFHVAENLDRF
jgi:hypothetical protein